MTIQILASMIVLTSTKVIALSPCTADYSGKTKKINKKEGNIGEFASTEII